MNRAKNLGSFNKNIVCGPCNGPGTAKAFENIYIFFCLEKNIVPSFLPHPREESHKIGAKILEILWVSGKG